VPWALLTLFVVIDPAGLVPVFISLAGGRSPQVQASIARRAVLIAAAVLLSFAIVGGPLLAYLGISVFALRIAGGILLFRIAVDMVFAQFRRETPEEEAEARAKEDISVFPLAIPLITGPGALASVLILGAEGPWRTAAVRARPRSSGRGALRRIPVPSRIDAARATPRADGHQRRDSRARADPRRTRGPICRRWPDRPGSIRRVIRETNGAISRTRR